MKWMRGHSQLLGCFSGMASMHDVFSRKKVSSGMRSRDKSDMS